MIFSQATTNLFLKSGTIYMPMDANRVDENSLKDFTINNQVYAIVQFSNLPNENLRSRFKNNGIKLLEYIPEKAFTCVFEINSLAILKNEPSVVSIVRLDFRKKISPSLALEIINISTKKIKVNIQLYDAHDIEYFKTTTAFKTLQLKQMAEQSTNFKGEISKKDIENLAKMPMVLCIEKTSPPGEKEDLGARILHRSNTIDQEYDNGLKYDGSGVSVLVRDDGKIGPHIDYQGRIDNSHASGISSFSTHGDMVSGILMGAGNLNPDVTGTAKGAFLYLTDYESEFLDETMDLYYKNHTVITSSSYSDGCNDGYTINSLTTDKQIYENPTLIHVFSAGNSGQTDCGYGAGSTWGNITGGHKMGKNSIATGNVNQDGIIEKSSSRGPASDGRIKPDICANGVGQLSTYPNNTINFGSGTSAAAPGISGTLAQLQQAYKVQNNGEEANSALLKACLLNSATDVGNPGPDFIYGWGIVNAGKAFDIINNKKYQHISLNQGEEKALFLTIPQNTANVKIMIYWADREASLISSKALVNDFDLVVGNPDNTKAYPYILNSTPDPDLLNLVAQNGIDHTNNMEQVELANPEAGSYQILIKANNLPFGKADCWLVYIVDNGTPTMVYPNGGEAFNQSKLVKLQWDATGNQGDFTIEYSNNNGTNWNLIKTLAGDYRSTYWKMPDTPMDSIWLKISRNNLSNTIAAPITILNQIDTVFLDKICPNTASIHWDTIPGASKYILYRLGDKYMEPIDTITATNIEFENNPGNDTWISVKPISMTGMPGKRSVAINLHKLFNCKQAVDLAMYPDTNFITNKVYCKSDQQILTVVLKNEGLDTIKGCNLRYKLGAMPEINKWVNQIFLPDSSILVNFDTLNLTNSFQEELKVKAEAIGETAFFNDSLSFNLNFLVQSDEGTALPYFQTFEDAAFPPLYWTTKTDDNQVNWDSLTCIGSNGKPSKVAWMNNFNNLVTGSYDDLVTEKFNLSNQKTAFLVYDYSYARFDADYNDTLIVQASTDCGENYGNPLLYQGGESLATVPNQEITFVPSSAQHWQSKAIPLSTFQGNKISFRFRNISDYSNSLCIDNVRLVENLRPEAYIIPTDTIVCISDTTSLEFYAKASPIGSYQWNFGENTIPKSALGQGPHVVKFSKDGLYKVKLYVANAGLTDSSEWQVNVLPVPNAQYNFTKNGQTISFTSEQQNAGLTHYWTFGDGQISIETNPVHQYVTKGDYQVSHTISSICGSAKNTQNILLTSLQESLITKFQVYPNPTKGWIAIESSDKITSINIKDLTGKSVKYVKGTSGHQKTFDLSDLVPGMYFIEIKSNKTVETQKIEIIRN